MSQPEVMDAPPVTDSTPDPNAKGNPAPKGCDGPSEAERARTEAYQQLQVAIHFQVEQIEKTLQDYYSKHFSEYFPDKIARTLRQWTVSRTQDSLSDMQVNFRITPSIPIPPPVNTVMAATKPAPPPTTTKIVTTDDVGTPPSGPTPPDPTKGQ